MSAFVKLDTRREVKLYDDKGILVEPPKGLLDPVDRNLPDIDPRAAFAIEPISKRIAALKDELARAFADLYLYKGRSSTHEDVASRIKRVKEILDTAECQEIDDLRELFSEVSRVFTVPEDELPLLRRQRTTRVRFGRGRGVKDKPLPPFKIVAADTARDNILYNLILGDGEDDWKDHFDDLSLTAFDKVKKKASVRDKVKLRDLRPKIKIRKDLKKAQTKAQMLKEDRRAAKKFFSVSETCIWKDWHNRPKSEIFQHFHYPCKENKYSEEFPIYFEYDPHYELDDKSEDDKSEITVGPNDTFIDYFSEVEFMHDADEYKKPYSCRRDKKLCKLYNRIFNNHELIRKQKYNEEIMSEKKPFFTRCVDYYGKYMKYDCLAQSTRKSKHDLYSPEMEKLIGKYEDDVAAVGKIMLLDVFDSIMDCHGQHPNYKLVNRNLITTQEYFELMSLPPHKAKQYEQELIALAKERSTRHSPKCLGCMRRVPKPKYCLTQQCLETEGNPRYIGFRNIKSTLRWKRHSKDKNK